MVHIDEKRFQRAFLEEVLELLESLNEKLLLLEHSPEDVDIINEIFRLTHSIKSESSLIGFMNISTIAHKMEDIFERVRRGALLVDTEIMNTLFASYDMIIELITAVQNNKDESLFDISDVVKRLSNVLKEDVDLSEEKENGKLETKTAKESPQNKEDEDKLIVNKTIIKKIDINFSDFEKNQIEDGLEKGETFYRIVFYLTDDCEMRYPRVYLVYNNFVSAGTVVKTIPDVLLEAADEKFSRVELYLLSNLKLDSLKKCADVDQVKKIDIGKIELIALKYSGMDLSNVSGYTEMLLSQEQIEEGEQIEREWQKQYESDLGKEKEKGVADTSTVEIRNEEIKKILTKDEKKDKLKAIQREMVIKKQTIRVDTDRLDNLMNLVGELIINHSRFLEIKNKINEQSSIQEIRIEIEDATDDLERISDQMQLGMMQVRMVPIGTVFSRFPRMVRDLANNLQKNVNLVILGETTEIDRSVIELITEPLTHLIRNSIDHGIENPDERERKGKPREGVIFLKAYQQGSNIYIEINDDGKGINIEKIRDKAIEKNLIAFQQAYNMTKEEMLNLIFEPGISTKKEITGLSGRGVGMDVVKNQIEKLRGSINIETNFGQGTDITIVLPLTLTIVEALLVNVGKSIFAIPLNVVEETLIIREEEIKDFDDYKVYNLRDETIAILYLSELVGIEKSNHTSEVFIVVVSYERRKIGLVVDELIGDQDIVIKALDESLKKLEGIAGATVLGDGRIALILDVSSLVKARKKELEKISAKSYGLYKKDSYKLDKIYDELNKTV